MKDFLSLTLYLTAIVLAVATLTEWFSKTKIVNKIVVVVILSLISAAATFWKDKIVESETIEEKEIAKKSKLTEIQYLRPKIKRISMVLLELLPKVLLGIN